MQTKDPYILLNELILVKEVDKKQQGIELKEYFKETYESLKPINILKNTFKKAASSPDLKSKVANAAIGITVGFLAKKLFGGNSTNPLIKIAGTLIGSFVGSKAEDNAEGIKSIGSLLVSKIANSFQSNGSGI